MFFLVGMLVVVGTAQEPADPQKARPVAESLTFDVASVKPQVPGKGGRGGSSPKDERGRIHYPAATLKGLLMNAYGVKDFQIVGPGWLGDERFTIDATMPPATTKDQTRAMLRNLLADRFKVELHRETKTLPVYSLAVATNGLKMPATPPPPAKENGHSGFATDGFPIVPSEATGVTNWVVNGQARINAQQATMRDLAAELEKLLGRPVMDETKLTAKFDFILTFSPEGLNGPNGPMRVVPKDAASEPEAREPLRDIFTALQSQIGIKLEQKQGLVERIVIDHAEKIPTDN